MTNAVIIKAGTSTNAILQGNIAKETHPDTRWRRIANTHLSDTQNATTLCHTIIHEVASYLYSLIKLLLAHGWFIKEVLRASGYLAIDNPRNVRKVVIDTNIDDTKMKTVLAAEHIHASTATGEVDHLLPSDLTRTDTHTLTLNTVIATQQQMTRMGQRRL